jgi:hypothetical protein
MINDSRDDPPPLCLPLQTSYQLGEVDYGGGELGGSWVVRLAAGLELQLTWLQPLLTPACWESLTLLLLDKLLARLEVLLGRKVRWGQREGVGQRGSGAGSSCCVNSQSSLAPCC